jgi:hypothetical protein
VRLHELKAPAVDGTNVHLNKSLNGHIGLLDGLTNAVMQFCSRFVRESERHNATRRMAFSKQSKNPFNEHLCLSRTSTCNDLQVTFSVINGLLLSLCERHQGLPPRVETSRHDESKRFGQLSVVVDAISKVRLRKRIFGTVSALSSLSPLG